MREAIARLVKGDAEIQLVGEASTLAQAIQLIDKLRPQIVVMDLHMPDDRLITPLQIKASLNGASTTASLWIFGTGRNAV